MQEKDSSKQILLSVLGVAILVVAVIGISFAAFNYSRTGETINTITTGTIVMSYTEAVNGINIVNATATENEVGKVLNGENNVFDFTVSATTSGDTINYAITATKEAGSTLQDSDVNVYLTSADDAIVEKDVTLVSALDKTSSDASGAPDGQYKLKGGTISSSNTTNYRLRMWLKSDYSAPEMGTSQTFKLRVNVYGKAAGA